MNYPSEYSEPNDRLIAVGDLVWANEGTDVGFIYEIIEDPSFWGLDEIGIMIQTLHPVGVKEKLSSPGLFFYPESGFQREGIGKLTEDENKEMGRAIQVALARGQGSDPVFSVSAYKKVDADDEDWEICFYEGTEVCRIERVAFTPGTRRKWDEQGSSSNS